MSLRSQPLGLSHSYQNRREGVCQAVSVDGTLPSCPSVRRQCRQCRQSCQSCQRCQCRPKAIPDTFSSLTRRVTSLIANGGIPPPVTRSVREGSSQDGWDNRPTESECNGCPNRYFPSCPLGPLQETSCVRLIRGNSTFKGGKTIWSIRQYRGWQFIPLVFSYSYSWSVKRYSYSKGSIGIR